MTNPYMAPAADVSLESPGDEEYQPTIFAWSGRIGRLRYLAYVFLYIAIGMALCGAVVGVFTLAGHGDKLPWEAAMMVLVYALMLIPVKRRFNDLDHSSWFALLVLIPIVNKFVGLYLMFGRGTDSRNQYGSMPCENPRGMLPAALAVPIIGIVAAIGVPAYQDHVRQTRAAKVSQAPLSPRLAEAPAAAQSDNAGRSGKF